MNFETLQNPSKIRESYVFKLPDFVSTIIANNVPVSALHDWRQGNSETNGAFQFILKVAFEL